MRLTAVVLVLGATVATFLPSSSAVTYRMEISHDFLALPDTVTFEIKPGSELQGVFILFEGDWVDAGPQALSVSEAPGAKIVVRDPDGDVVWTLRHANLCGAAASASDPFGWGCGPWIFEEYDPARSLAPGAWTVEFSGAGATTGVVKLYGEFP